MQLDILRSLDNNCVTFFVLLDLSAAFDTLDYQTLLLRLEKLFCITDKPFAWMPSYLITVFKMCVQMKHCRRLCIWITVFLRESPWSEKLYNVYQTHWWNMQVSWSSSPFLRRILSVIILIQTHCCCICKGCFVSHCGLSSRYRVLGAQQYAKTERGQV